MTSVNTRTGFRQALKFAFSFSRHDQQAFRLFSSVFIDRIVCKLDFITRSIASSDVRQEILERRKVRLT